MKQQAKIIRKASAKETILLIPIGKEVIIKTRDIKESAIRSAISRLNKEGYSFMSTNARLINEVKVTRIK